MQIKEFAERHGVTTGTLTVAVGKLKKKGLVVRKQHRHDRRSLLVALTEKGEIVFAQHGRFHQDFTEDISADLSNDEMLQLSTLTEQTTCGCSRRRVLHPHVRAFHRFGQIKSETVKNYLTKIEKL